MLAYLRKLPMLFILVAGVCAGFFLYSEDHESQSLRGEYARLTTSRENDLASFMNLAHTFGEKGQWDELNQVLEQGRLAKRIDFYILQHRGQAVWFGGRENDESEWFNVPLKVSENILQEESISFRSEKIGNDYQIVVGLEKNPAAFNEANSYQRRMFTLQNGMFVFLIVLIVGIWTLKDIMLMVRQVRRGKRGDINRVSATSAEAEVFMKSLNGYSNAMIELEAENVKLGRQVLPSLQKEIHSGRKPPYDFDCTMVRTDINHFSTIFNTHNVTEFMATINSFFDEVSHIVARYGGLIHEFVGDEVIYYFKDDEHTNSFAIALSAIRDVNEAASRYHAMTMKARGYPFTVKSSAAHGKVRFGPLVGGFTVAGAVLIETVRILSFIQEKDDNVIYFDGVHASRVQELIQSHARMSVKMKGYQSEISLYQYDAHLPLTHILKTLSDETADQLLYFRSDRDLLAIIDSLRTVKRTASVQLRAVSALRHPHIARAQQKAGPSLRAWIEELKLSDAKVLSSAVMLYINLVPRADFTSDDAQLLEGLLTHEDRRVVANVVETLTAFAHTDRLPKAKKIEDLRTAANTLVYEGRNEITSKTLKHLNGFLRSKNVNMIASGLYALGELAKTHRKQDVKYFASQVDFQHLISKLPDYAAHTTTMVRRQALIAARKCGNEDVIAKIRDHVKDSGSELLQEELERYLDSSLSSKKPAA